MDRISLHIKCKILIHKIQSYSCTSDSNLIQDSIDNRESYVYFHVGDFPFRYPKEKQPQGNQNNDSKKHKTTSNTYSWFKAVCCFMGFWTS